MNNNSRIRPSVRSPRGQKGFSLIEMAIVLAIAAAILFGIFYVVGVVQSKRVTTAESQNLTVMASDLRTKFSNQGTFAGLNNQTAQQLNLVPASMISGGGIISGYGTAVVISSANVNGVADDGFSFTYDVPANSCSDFVAGTEGAFSRITIAGQSVKDLSLGDGALSVADLALCNASAAANNDTTIVFSQGR